MSIRLMQAVWDRLGVSGGEHALALALADVGDDDGRGIFPSVNRLCWKTRQSRRAVQRQLRILQGFDWLQLVRPSKGGRYKSAEYRINPDWVRGAKLAQLPDHPQFDPKVNYGVIGNTKPRHSAHETAPLAALNSSGSILNHKKSGFADVSTEGTARRRIHATVNGLSSCKRIRP